MLKPRDIGAYRDLLVLFTRYGRKDFTINFESTELFIEDELSAHSIEPDVQQRAKAFAESLKKMGPTYVKFGQVLSTRPDIVPREYIDELEALQDAVEPFSFADVERIVEEELGVRISKAFRFFEATPTAAASLGQVHRAALRDGREVMVKVQRPGVRDQVRRDLEVFADIAKSLEEHTSLGQRMNLVGAVEQARMTLFNELNYLVEASNAETLRQNLAAFNRIYVPRVIHDYTSARVLTTELVRGEKVSRLSALQMIDHDYKELADVITHAYLKQICVDGFWHSDPHPGNIFIRDVDGAPQIVLLDFGMVSRINHELEDDVIKMLLAVSSNRGTEAAEASVRMSEPLDRFDTTKFVHEISRLVASVHSADAAHLNVGQVIFKVITIATKNDLKAPPELTMLAKTLLNLDSITKRLNPEFDAQSVTRSYAESLVAQKLQQKFNPRNFYPALLDLNQFVLDFPQRAREIIDLTAAGRMTFGIKLTQAEEFLGGIHKIANRITVGVVIAALLVASSLMIRVPGYQTVAMIGYVLAAI